MSARLETKRGFKAGVGLLAIATVSGCATFGGNVRGDFSCSAPDGVCAPSSTIDDQALAMISGEEGGAPALRSGAGTRTAVRSDHLVTRPALRPDGEIARTQERVLRIVIQPYIDDRGVLHETSAVRAVVARGEWRSESLPYDTSFEATKTAPASEALADTLERFDPPIGLVDPNAPDPAAVAAARARAADPVAAIKADVAERLGAQSRAPAATQKPIAPATDDAPAAGRTNKPPTLSGPSAAGGPEAFGKVKSAQTYRAAISGAAEQARGSAADADDQVPGRGRGEVVKASDFPADVPEDH